MSDEVIDAGGKRDRSPKFPFIGLPKAIERTGGLLKSAKRFDVRMDDAANVWGLRSTSSSFMQTVGALLAFGLLDATGSGDNRRVRVSDAAQRILEDGRPGVREKLLAAAALKPKVIAHYFDIWGHERPDDAHCLSSLRFDGGFTDEASKTFLRIYDETLRLAIPPIDDKHSELVSDEAEVAIWPAQPIAPPAEPPVAGVQNVKTSVMSGERELTTGLLSKGGASFRLIVSGKIGEKEIERLIRKLELDKEILADDSEEGVQDS